MPYNIPRFPLDTTGNNPNNYIIDEPHTLSNRPIRAVSPNYGPFFTHNLIVKDGSNFLVRGQDYQITELHQEATLRYGKEIASVILIINPNVSSNITISYQVLGGHYAYDDTTIANVYQAVINDNRPVAWTNIINKPSEFNPTIHRHLLEDIFGFEPIVDVLERIKRAITLGQSEVLLNVLNQLLNDKVCLNSYTKYADLLHILSHRKLLSSISCDIKNIEKIPKNKICLKTGIITKGRSITIEIDNRGYPINSNINYKFITINNESLSTLSLQGSLVTNNDIKRIDFYVNTQENIDIDKIIYLLVDDSVIDEDILAISNKLVLEEAPKTTDFVTYFINTSLHTDYYIYDIADYNSESYLEELRLFNYSY